MLSGLRSGVSTWVSPSAVMAKLQGVRHLCRGAGGIRGSAMIKVKKTPFQKTFRFPLVRVHSHNIIYSMAKRQAKGWVTKKLVQNGFRAISSWWSRSPGPSYGRSKVAESTGKANWGTFTQKLKFLIILFN